MYGLIFARKARLVGVTLTAFAPCVLHAGGWQSAVTLEDLKLPAEARLSRFGGGGVAARDLLVKAAFDQTLALSERWRAVTTMGRINFRYFRPVLSRALVADEWFLRNAALIAFLNASRGDAVARSLGRLRDPALLVRTQAVRNLIALGAREAAPDLWREIQSVLNFSNGRSLWVRAHMAEALAAFARPGETTAFAKLLGDSDRRLHRWAIEGLEKSSGLILTDKREPTEVRRRKWQKQLMARAV